MTPPEQPRPRITEEGRARALEAARAMAQDLGTSSAMGAYEAQRWHPSFAELPTLHLDDVSAIPFLVGVEGVEEYQHRGRLRAGDDDLFAAVTLPAPGYEEYCRARLGLGSPRELLAASAEAPLAVAEACRKDAALGILTERARAAGGFAIHPYMGIESVWELAADLARAAEVPVGVLAPPPPITWIANDKRHLSDLVAAAVDPTALVETRVTRTAAELATALLDLAGRHERVALKRLRTASAMGNALYESSALRALAPEAERSHKRGSQVPRSGHSVKWCHEKALGESARSQRSCARREEHRLKKH